jgi:hypothetical protein
LIGHAFVVDLHRHVTTTSISSMKHQLQSSPGSNDEMIACLDLRKCLRAWRFFESSQHPTCPHVLHKRRCTQVSPIARHSWQPFPLGLTAFTMLR